MIFFVHKWLKNGIVEVRLSRACLGKTSIDFHLTATAVDSCI